MTVRIVSPTEKAEILNKFRQGQAKTDIALEYEVSPRTISRVLIEKGGIQKAWRSEIRLTKEEADMLWDMRENGTKPQDMLPFTKLRVFDVFRWFRKQKLTKQKMLARMMVQEIKQQKSA